MALILHNRSAFHLTDCSRLSHETRLEFRILSDLKHTTYNAVVREFHINFVMQLYHMQCDLFSRLHENSSHQRRKFVIDIPYRAESFAYFSRLEIEPNHQSLAVSIVPLFNDMALLTDNKINNWHQLFGI